MPSAPLKHRIRVKAQSALSRLGAHLSLSQISTLNACINYLEVGRWLNAKGFRAWPRYADREQLYSAVAANVRAERVLYLEFGVWQGSSMRSWSRLLQNPLASLHGFDSFEGLPEAWDARRPRGTFSRDGALPTFEDSRVILHKGWFNDTLPAFALPEHERLVLNLDADLYSSTIFVLRALAAAIRPGTLLIFDEFCDRLHEMRAFGEFLEATGMEFQFLGGTENLEQVVFERLD
jgi:hypothetical protein